MNSDEIKSIIALGEGYQAEFKISIPSKVRELTEEVCAFANSAGGILILGVNNKNEIKGISIDNNARSSIQNSLLEINPKLDCTLEFIDVDGVSIAAINVPSGRKKPYVYSGAIFIRVGPNTQKLTTAEEMREFFQNSEKIYFDDSGVREFTLSTDLDNENFKTFRDAGLFSSGIPEKQIFENLQVFTEDGFVKAGAVLFFGKSPESLFPHAIIRCVSFKGTDKRYITDDKKFAGPLLAQYHGCLEWLRGKINVSYDIEGQGGGPRKENWEIPETVFKEALVNALAHRDYYEKGAVTTVEVFDDRVEISNPGGLLAAVVKDFGKRSLSRNPLIFGLFERMHLVEKIGSGIPRMEQLMVEAGLPAPSYAYDGLFTITLARAIKFEAWKDLWRVKLSEPRLAILHAINNHPEISKRQLADALAISTTAIDNHLEVLKRFGVLERVGPDKGGYWKINYLRP